MRNIGDNMYKSLRIAKNDFICKHVPFYIDLDNLDEEEKYYIENNGLVLSIITNQHFKKLKDLELSLISIIKIFSYFIILIRFGMLNYNFTVFTLKLLLFLL